MESFKEELFKLYISSIISHKFQCLIINMIVLYCINNFLFVYLYVLYYTNPQNVYLQTVKYLRFERWKITPEEGKTWISGTDEEMKREDVESRIFRENMTKRNNKEK